MARAAWAGEYVGIEFFDRGRTAEGCDCYGLVRLVLWEQFGIKLHDLEADYADANDRAGITKIVERREAIGWVRLHQGPYREGCVALFRLQGLPVHVGVLVNGDEMLHVVRGCNAVLESITSPLWRHRLEGVYQYYAD